MKPRFQRECIHHGLTEYCLEGSANHARCLKCRAEKVTNHRRKTKEKLVALCGGKCEICGYNRCLWALEFHHKDPQSKSFSISSKGNIRSFNKIVKEAEKCILVCSNCHCEIESGQVSID